METASLRARQRVLLPEGDVVTLLNADGVHVCTLSTARATAAGDAFVLPPPPYVPPRPRVRVCGWLEKLGGGTRTFGRRSYKRRWIVLSEGCMTYFKSEGAERGGARPLKDAVVALNGFSVAAAELTIYLRNKVSVLLRARRRVAAAGRRWWWWCKRAHAPGPERAVVDAAGRVGGVANGLG